MELCTNINCNSKLPEQFKTNEKVAHAKVDFTSGTEASNYRLLNENCIEIKLINSLKAI